MPTPKPKPVIENVPLREKRRREIAVTLVEMFIDEMGEYAYSTRSHMPCGSDYTNFTEGLERIRKFCKARPDWALEILRTLGILNLPQR